jgi:chromosome condensin MukBEF ATPase and DNA-binding subunit MukB
MTKDEALKLALEALENISTALREDDVLGSDSELMLNAITAIKEALDECDEDELIIRYHEMTIKRLEKRIEELTAHPQQSTWVGLTDEEIADCAEKMEASDPTDSFWREFFRGIEAKLKEKNT